MGSGLGHGQVHKAGWWMLGMWEIKIIEQVTQVSEGESDSKKEVIE